MGNILSLHRKGAIVENIDPTRSEHFGDMDILSYSYDQGNKLLQVTDTGNTAFGFKDGIHTNDDFEYDANGNMIIDRNKGITGITYNHLNLPTTVSISNSEGTGTISYIYDATGAKLKKSVPSGGSLIETEYAGKYVYRNNVLQYLSTPEGYATPNGSSYRYVYQFKDHLDNVRLSYAKNDSGNLEIIEEGNYYPFGLKHKGYNSNVSSLGNSTAQLLKFGSKELQDELGLIWYDISARNYDPALARWMNLDPLAEHMRRHSTYNYAFDNPIYFIDPDGMMPLANDGGGKNPRSNNAGLRMGRAALRKVKSLWNSAKSFASRSAAQNAAAIIVSIGANENLGNGTRAALNGDVKGVVNAVNESINASIDQIALTEGVSRQEAGLDWAAGIAVEIGAGLATDGLAAGLGRGTGLADDAIKVMTRPDKFSLSDVNIKNVDILQGEADLGWFDGNTVSLNINSIQKSPLAPKNSGFGGLIEYAEDLAKQNNMSNVRLEFGPVMNARLKTDAAWAQEYGYYFSSSTDNLGNSVITWEKSLE